MPFSTFIAAESWGERDIYTKEVQKEGEGRGGAMNITALINRKTATKRNETKANLDVGVSSSGNILFDLNSFKEIKKPVEYIVELFKHTEFLKNKSTA